jgi:xanthine/CO dehydrogenase XdhC/CoxF family maturation factor
MDDVYAELANALAAGEKSVLARIIRQAGSAPRTVGTRLLVKAADDLHRVHCPIGVAIGAQTPEEIAVSIVAELIQVRAQAHAERRPAAEIR